VHFSRGLALHTGHGTDNIRFRVSGAVPTPNCSTWSTLKMVNFALLFDRFSTAFGPPVAEKSLTNRPVLLPQETEQYRPEITIAEA
jgi:hypothetical protein